MDWPIVHGYTAMCMKCVSVMFFHDKIPCELLLRRYIQRNGFIINIYWPIDAEVVIRVGETYKFQLYSKEEEGSTFISWK